MHYDIKFEKSAILDLRDLAFYEVQFTFSIEKSKERVHSMMEEIREALTIMPARYPEKSYGFTDTLRRAYPLGKYRAFYWIDEPAGKVQVERILHSRANASFVHFEN